MGWRPCSSGSMTWYYQCFTSILLSFWHLLVPKWRCETLSWLLKAQNQLVFTPFSFEVEVSMWLLNAFIIDTYDRYEILWVLELKVNSMFRTKVYQCFIWGVGGWVWLQMKHVSSEVQHWFIEMTPKSISSWNFLERTQLPKLSKTELKIFSRMFHFCCKLTSCGLWKL